MATTKNFGLPLPADSTLVKDTPALLRQANTATETALTESGTRVSNAEAAALEAAERAAAAAELAQSPADPVVAAMLRGTAGSTPAAVLANKHTPFVGALKRWRAALLGQRTAGIAVVNAGSSTANGGNATADNRRWFYRLAAALGPRQLTTDLAVKKPANGVQFYNTAVGGTHSGNYLPTDKQNAILALKPELILHMIGSNDWANGVAIATYKANVRARVVQFMNGTPAVQVLIHQQPRFDVTSPKIPWDQYGAALAEIAAEFPDRVVFLDLSERFEAMGPGADAFSLLHPDRIHLMDEGNRIMANMIADFLGVGINYTPRTLIEFKGAPAGGDLGAGQKYIADIRVPARPYLQQAVFSASVFANATSNADLELLDESVAGAHYSKAFRLHDYRSAQGGSMVCVIPPHTEGFLRVRASNYGGGAMYVTGSAAFASIYADVSPL